jgi:hypothetical protein
VDIAIVETPVETLPPTASAAVPTNITLPPVNAMIKSYNLNPSSAVAIPPLNQPPLIATGPEDTSNILAEPSNYNQGFYGDVEDEPNENASNLENIQEGGAIRRRKTRKHGAKKGGSLSRLKVSRKKRMTK